jgi:hypothetical protein
MKPCGWAKIPITWPSSMIPQPTSRLSTSPLHLWAHTPASKPSRAPHQVYDKLGHHDSCIFLLGASPCNKPSAWVAGILLESPRNRTLQ